MSYGLQCKTLSQNTNTQKEEQEKERGQKV